MPAVAQSPVIVACGSMGGGLCWKLPQDKARRIKRCRACCCSARSGTTAFSSARPSRRKVPVFFGHGSRDKVFPVEKQEAFYPLDPEEGARLSGALRALRDRHARHADPHDRLARDAQLDAGAGAIASAFQMPRDAPLDPFGGVAQRFDQHQVEERGPDVGLEVEAAREGAGA
jgi:hypothetical protein